MHLEPAKGEESSGARPRFKRKPSRIRAWRRTWLGQVHRAGRSGADWIIPEEEVMPNTFQEHCCGCPYREKYQSTKKLPLSMERNSDDVLLILEAPGCEEWRNRQPLCNEGSRPPSATDKIIASVKRITGDGNDWRRHFSITNAVQCYPERGRNGRDKKPRKPAQRQCAKWLKRDIDSRPWRRVVVFGRIAEKSVRYLAWRSIGFTFRCRRNIMIGNQEIRFEEESVTWKGNDSETRFCFVPHPTSTYRDRWLSDDDLDNVLRWALEIKGASSRARRT